MWVFALTKGLHKGKPIALLAFLANVRDTLNKIGVCEEEAVWVLAYLLNVGGEKVHEA